MSGSDKVRVALVGVGYWGPNLARNIGQCPGARFAGVCDRDGARAKSAAAPHQGAFADTNFAATLARPDVDAVVLATPSGLHYEQTKAALQAGKHVMVEKPLAHTAQEATELVQLAAKANRVLMVGHTFLYNNVVRDVKRRIDGGELGTVRYIYAQRLNLGRFRTDSDVMWTLAPHDVSILNMWLDARPVRVSARGYSYIYPKSGVAEVAFVHLEYPDGRSAHLHLSWLDPQKRREMVIVGSDKMLVYDDGNPDAHIQLYDKKAEAEHQGELKDFADFTTRLRAGDLVIPNIRLVEPLKVEIAHFIECIAQGKKPITDGVHGLDVVTVLECASRSMAADGKFLDIEYPSITG
ncbi:MAG: Gfo/Idh/MocA family oxidoreductase [Xanthobacteraceae bacterium]|nr:Gfo/Idh/MocA family oxidoreductase [Xanthobacteraceae bacterium]